MCFPTTELQSFEIVRWATSVAIPAVSGLAGVVIGAWLTSRREVKQRKLAFLEKQVSTFYSPNEECRTRIQYTVGVSPLSNA